MSRDPRYGTAAWQTLRRAVLDRDGHFCRIQGERCHGHASTVHHIVASSVRPDLFWEPQNLAASCTACNYGDGARIAAGNRRQRIARLEQLVQEQQQTIARLREQLAAYENRVMPAIY
jgi:5-methylcytosine-specific restriction endonuclease McrA